MADLWNMMMTLDNHAHRPNLWLKENKTVSTSAFSEAQANYFFIGNIIKEEFPKALRQDKKSLWDSSALLYKPGHEIDSAVLIPNKIHNVQDWIFKHSRRSDAFTQLKMLRNEYRKLYRAKMDTKTFNEFLDRARDAFTALGVSTDSLDATRKFSVVNEFSAVGLQSLIKQPWSQVASDSKMDLLKRREIYGNNIWIRGQYLGGGSFGKVYTLTHYPTETMVAMKVVEMEPKYTETTKDVRQLQNEIDILSKLRHKRIVTCHGSEQKGNHFYLFMDFMAEGSLHDYIKREGNLDENLSRKYTRQILEGVGYLHSKEIIHRDIKGPNVLLDSEGNVKLADFGISKEIQKIGSKTDLTSFVGSLYWMAPEILWGKGYGRKVDIWTRALRASQFRSTINLKTSVLYRGDWSAAKKLLIGRSVGCTVVEMLTGRPPLGHLEPQAAMFRIGNKPLEPKLPEGVSQDVIDFVQVALTWRPEERPRCAELLRHAFIQPIVSDHWQGVRATGVRKTRKDVAFIKRKQNQEKRRLSECSVYDQDGPNLSGSCLSPFVDEHPRKKFRPIDKSEVLNGPNPAKPPDNDNLRILVESLLNSRATANRRRGTSRRSSTSMYDTSSDRINNHFAFTPGLRQRSYHLYTSGSESDISESESIRSSGSDTSGSESDIIDYKSSSESDNSDIRVNGTRAYRELRRKLLTLSEDELSPTDTENSSTENRAINGPVDRKRKKNPAHRPRKATSDSDMSDLPPMQPLDLVWAKRRGYPSYPALIINPRTKKSFLHRGVPIPVPPGDVLRQRAITEEHLYLVLFFDQRQTWKWLPRHKLEPLGQSDKQDESKLQEGRETSMRKSVMQAYGRAIRHKKKMEREGSWDSEDEDADDEDADDEDARRRFAND